MMAPKIHEPARWPVGYLAALGVGALAAVVVHAIGWERLGPVERAGARR
jgi:hypothetical protein